MKKCLLGAVKHQPRSYSFVDHFPISQVTAVCSQNSFDELISLYSPFAYSHTSQDVQNWVEILQNKEKTCMESF